MQKEADESKQIKHDKECALQLNAHLLCIDQKLLLQLKLARLERKPYRWVKKNARNRNAFKLYEWEKSIVF